MKEENEKPAVGNKLFRRSPRVLDMQMVKRTNDETQMRIKKEVKPSLGHIAPIRRSPFGLKMSKKLAVPTRRSPRLTNRIKVEAPVKIDKKSTMTKHIKAEALTSVEKS